MNTNIQRTWTVEGKMIREDQVTVWDADYYLFGELLSTLERLFLVMREHNDSLGSPMGMAGGIGEVVTGHVNERMDQVFHHLHKKHINIEVIVANHETPGVPCGTIIAVEILQSKEVRS